MSANNSGGGGGGKWYSPMKAVNWMLEAMLIKDVSVPRRAPADAPGENMQLPGEARPVQREGDEVVLVHAVKCDDPSLEAFLCQRLAKEFNLYIVECTGGTVSGRLANAIRSNPTSEGFLVQSPPFETQPSDMCKCNALPGVFVFVSAAQFPPSHASWWSSIQTGTAHHSNHPMEIYERVRPMFISQINADAIVSIDEPVKLKPMRQMYCVSGRHIKSLIDKRLGATLNTLRTIASNLVMYGGDPKYRTINASSTRFHEVVGSHVEAMCVLQAFGFREVERIVGGSAPDAAPDRMLSGDKLSTLVVDETELALYLPDIARTVPALDAALSVVPYNAM